MLPLRGCCAGAARRLHSTSPRAPAPPPVRVRYAPSPTGFLHLGGLRTALYNYLFARATGGAFLLRIEDTDKSRQVPGSVEGLIRALRWCGLDYDEGPATDATGAAVVGDVGSHGPYIQSQRLPVYAAAADQLLRSGHAYRCFCSPERLAAVREGQAKRGQPTLYDRTCTRLPPGEADRRAAAGEPHVVRLFVPPGATAVDDAVVGEVRFGHAVVDDQVLLKSDGYPTYHLASVVDDHAMGISHVIRGQEWLSSTPKHALLYAALGWAPPSFAHLPLLLNPDRSKLSKRHGDAAVEDFVAAGYTPEGLVNFVALLGWTPAGSHDHHGGGEVMSLADMVARFSLADVNKANAVVDRARLDHFNGEHIKHMLLGSSPESKQAAAAPAAAPAATAALAKGGKAPPPPPAPPAPLELADTPTRARVRQAVATVVDPLLAALHAHLPPSSLPAATPFVPSTQRLPAPSYNAVLSAQRERVAVYGDFAPLVLPFLASADEFRALLQAQLWAPAGAGAASAPPLVLPPGSKVDVRAAAVRVYRHAVPPPAPAVTAAATDAPSDAPVPPAADTAVPDAELHRYLAGMAPALGAVADGWDALADAAFADAPAAPVKKAAKAAGLPPGKLMLPLRLALTGLDVGASLTDTMRLLGRVACVARARAFAADAAAAAARY